MARKKTSAAKKSKETEKEEVKEEAKQEEAETAAAPEAEAKPQAEAASDLPLFYNNPVALDATKHGKLGLIESFGLKFAAGTNAVPVNMIEMPQICHCYPIAFSPDENASPVAVLGLRDSENLFVDSEYKWEENMYIPAYIRRYPFIFSEIPGHSSLSLCVDHNEDVVSEDSPQKFFSDEGEASDLSKNALDFCKSYHSAAQQTAEFCKAVKEADLLIERRAEITVADGTRINFSGFRIIDEQKFNALSNDTILEWRKKGWLPFVYAHFFSGGQWQRLTRLLNKRVSSK